MTKKKSMVEELAALKSKYDKIKSETEEFIELAKHLSDKGAHEARDLIEIAKSNWKEIVANFKGSTIASFFSKSAKDTKKKAKDRSRSKKSSKVKK